MLLASLFGVVMGLVLGLTGAGGGILAVPALVLGLGWTMTQAAPVALFAVGSAAAVGVAIVNPVVGAATLLANTVLQKPLNRLFSYRYHVTGTWADPKIDKAGEAPPEVKPSVEEDNKP